MLEPQTRAALTDMLHPPSGFTLSHAVATTFTLDLETALTVPLSFAARRVSASDDQIGILDAVRRAAGRVDIFAQTGAIALGGSPSRLLAFLEPMIHPVEVRQGIFHPKVWVLEFVRGDKRAYRLICSSRNLTADRSWDTVVCLDGEPASGDRLAASRDLNEPIARLLLALPELTVQPLDQRRRDRLASLAARIRDVDWQCPPEVRSLAFHLWGVGERPASPFTGIRALIVSPFLSDDGLTEILAGVNRETHLISRATSIDAIAPSTAHALGTVYVLDDAADPAAQEGQVIPVPGRGQLTGLHAKTFVFDRRSGSHAFLGSLNATRAALHDNVEFMVEVEGAGTRLGVDATLKALGEFAAEFASTRAPRRKAVRRPPTGRWPRPCGGSLGSGSMRRWPPLTRTSSASGARGWRTCRLTCTSRGTRSPAPGS